ncbi:hypothetical protein [Massilia yuzhufengensis]|uniref:Uncharacterized protein n=1 Tax=Massilia yuzhufengensis TaxID=1164594 RepID=A0A1I1S3B4_9BURK|nr:hypothetical protein [Massilia yuzhufengensis]SFD41025.1 hypothetical protein SAMN05216204_12451 [Massilia yuzhufengensis]
MEKLIAQLLRLYLMPALASSEDLAQHFQGIQALSVPLASSEDLTRAIVIDFPKTRGGAPDQHWTNLCEVANTLQEAYGFPAPAVSITGASSFQLWMSLAEPVPVGDARRFLAMLREAHFPELDLQAQDRVDLPPSLNPASGKWAAFIHPGMGASFAEEAGLEMAPPVAAQVAFLEGLESIGKAEFFDALVAMKQSDVPIQAPPAVEPPSNAGLLLQDATLEDIVRHLHAINIEPTFRHLLPAAR